MLDQLRRRGSLLTSWCFLCKGNEKSVNHILLQLERYYRGSMEYYGEERSKTWRNDPSMFVLDNLAQVKPKDL